MAQIGFTDKVAINTNPDIPDINKVTDADMNEIKSVVNANYTECNNIIESGSNTNGKYVKFSDGTLIQWNSMTVQDQAMSNAYGPAFQGSRVITFPVDFYDTNYSAQCSHFLHGTGASWGSVANTTSKSQMTIRGMDFFTRATGTSCSISWLAIGRWKA